MNFLNILTQLAEVDSDVLDRLNPRRAVFASLGTVAKRSALAATPVLLASMFQKAYAGTNAGNPVDVFNYALTLEQLEADFYNKVQASPFFLTASAADQAAIKQISKHETAHVALLTTVVQGIGGTPVTGNTFKTSVFATLTSFAAQLQVAQLLEDTGVRAYKGRATDLQGIADVNIPGVGTINPLESALRIHSVEARHAAHIRGMRMQTAWISGTGDLDTQATYQGATPESNTTQAGYNLTMAGVITPSVTYSATDVAAAFDEILTPAEVLAIAMPLIGA
ncbi:ferritin-like domain-containing protein [Hymenobacter psoromatis]|uniref:ferritin-like domain-containing protein n=1 Tax=Hymenobacter psoromatis TaxID=1484116 RepID=UPI001CC00D5B|nr:ferritin-like domain-containing protein [Hymenobacter psoromatis]